MMESIGKVWTFTVGHPAAIQGVARVLSDLGVDGATLTPTFGLWHGQLESSVVVHIADVMTFARAHRIAERLRYAFEQDAVLLVNPNGDAFLITGEDAEARAALARVRGDRVEAFRILAGEEGNPAID